LEAGEVALQFAPEPVSELISAALLDCAGVQSMREIRLEIHDPQCRVNVDSAWARKIFVHLIRNADLYSSPGEPITIETEEMDGFIAFRFTDRGPGIEESEISSIFERFYRGKRQRHRVPGTGMGLSIAKTIAESHGENIKVSSRKGQGSVFTVSLPIYRGEINVS
jgi:signal transduction histidine kinase